MIRDNRGQVTAIATIERDISELLKTQQPLNRVREELQMATSAARIGTWFADFSRGISQWNEELYRLLAQILKNLVENAVKFNNNAAKKVDIGWHQPAKDSYIEIFVHDNGIGIAPRYQQQIFDISATAYRQRI